MGRLTRLVNATPSRAVARTILDEVLGVRPDYIEHQVAHAVRDPNGRAYNRTAHLPERRKMMQQWADYLDKLKAGADVIPIRQGRLVHPTFALQFKTRIPQSPENFGCDLLGT
jgi:hypothetical protein